METKVKDLKELENVVQDLKIMVSTDFGVKAIIIALCGPMGAGKTAFTKILAKKLGIKESVTSPTFVLHIPHKIICQLPFANCQLNLAMDHIDLWRVEKWEEVERLGLSQMIDNKDLIMIEWADKFSSQLLAYRSQGVQIVWVEIGYGEEKNERVINVGLG